MNWIELAKEDIKRNKHSKIQLKDIQKILLELYKSSKKKGKEDG